MSATPIKLNTEIEIKPTNTAFESDSDFCDEFGDDYFKQPESTTRLPLKPKQTLLTVKSSIVTLPSFSSSNCFDNKKLP